MAIKCARHERHSVRIGNLLALPISTFPPISAAICSGITVGNAHPVIRCFQEIVEEFHLRIPPAVRRYLSIFRELRREWGWFTREVWPPSHPPGSIPSENLGQWGKKPLTAATDVDGSFSLSYFASFLRFGCVYCGPDGGHLIPSRDRDKWEDNLEVCN